MSRKSAAIVGIIIAVVAVAFYLYGREVGTVAGAAGAVAAASQFRKRGREEERVDEVVEEAHEVADEIRGVARDDPGGAAKLDGDELANRVDELT